MVAPRDGRGDSRLATTGLGHRRGGDRLGASAGGTRGLGAAGLLLPLLSGSLLRGRGKTGGLRLKRGLLLLLVIAVLVVLLLSLGLRLGLALLALLLRDLGLLALLLLRLGLCVGSGSGGLRASLWG